MRPKCHVRWIRFHFKRMLIMGLGKQTLMLSQKTPICLSFNTSLILLEKDNYVYNFANLILLKKKWKYLIYYENYKRLQEVLFLKLYIIKFKQFVFLLILCGITNPNFFLQTIEIDQIIVFKTTQNKIFNSNILLYLKE